MPSPISERSGVEHARAAYRASVAAGSALSRRALADQFGISRRQAANIVDGAERALTLVGSES
jgi:hypothetical protein